MPKKGEYIQFKNFRRKIESPFMIYANFESIIVSEDNVKQNSNESFTNKYHKNVACSYGYRLVCVDDKFSKLFKLYLDENALYSFISSMIRESKYCSNVMKKHFNKELVMTKKDMKILRTSLIVGFVVMIILIMMLKYKINVVALENIDSAHRDCNINDKLNQKILVKFHNLKNYDSILLCKNQVNSILKEMSYQMKKMQKVHEFLSKDDFKYLDQQFDNNLLDLIKQKGFYPDEYINNFEKLKEKLPRKETFYSS